MTGFYMNATLAWKVLNGFHTRTLILLFYKHNAANMKCNSFLDFLNYPSFSIHFHLLTHQGSHIFLLICNDAEKNGRVVLYSAITDK